MSKKRPSILFVFFLFLFVFTVISMIQKSVFLSQQKTILDLDYKLQIYKDITSDLRIKISELSVDERIIELAKTKLDMLFPKSEDIICVQRYRVSRDNFNYSFLNFFSPEAVAADK